MPLSRVHCSPRDAVCPSPLAKLECFNADRCCSLCKMYKRPRVTFFPVHDCCGRYVRVALDAGGRGDRAGARSRPPVAACSAPDLFKMSQYFNAGRPRDVLTASFAEHCTDAVPRRCDRQLEAPDMRQSAPLPVANDGPRVTVVVQGNDAGSTFYAAKCAKCKVQLGKVKDGAQV